MDRSRRSDPGTTGRVVDRTGVRATGDPALRNDYTNTDYLKDGSRVTLNRYSALTVPKNFKGTAREVTLRGEALFEVAKNAGKPFRVVTGELTVEVLGTVFNVNAYRENPEIVTTLLEGRVAVREIDNGQELLLSPGERAVYSLNEKELVHDTGTDTERVVAWQKGILIFSGESLEDIARILSNHFNIPVKVTDEALAGYRVTADFTDNEDLETILNLLIHVAPFSWERAEQTIILKPKID